MEKLNKSLSKLVDKWYTDEQKKEVEDLLESTPEFMWGKINYGILAIGLGEKLVNLSTREVYAYYKWPTWKANEVDILIARVACSLKSELGEDIFDHIEEPNMAVEYYACLVEKIINKHIRECQEIVLRNSDVSGL